MDGPAIAIIFGAIFLFALLVTYLVLAIRAIPKVFGKGKRLLGVLLLPMFGWWLYPILWGMGVQLA